jgi:hypothetical protein
VGARGGAGQDIEGGTATAALQAIAACAASLQNRFPPRGTNLGLEEILDASRGATGAAGSSASAALSRASLNANARDALRRELRSNPVSFAETVEENMRKAFHFGGSTPHPGAPSVVTARAYLEHRSSVQGSFEGTVFFLWTLAGIHQALVEERPAEARARACLGLVAGEQMGIDGGSWRIAREFLFEDPPPMASFQGHRLPVLGAEAQLTRLADPRWHDVALGTLHVLADVDSRRQALGIARGSPSLTDGRPPTGSFPGTTGAGNPLETAAQAEKKAAEQKAAKAQAKAKAKAKKKEAEKKAEAPKP